MPFKKGQTGNPEGRRAEDRKVKLLARQHTDKAIAKLAHWMESDNPKASVAAACALLDRGFGKPRQTIEADVYQEHQINVGGSDAFAARIEQALRNRAPSQLMDQRLEPSLELRPREERQEPQEERKPPRVNGRDPAAPMIDRYSRFRPERDPLEGFRTDPRIVFIEPDAS
jgi:hypothetical protein